MSNHLRSNGAAAGYRGGEFKITFLIKQMNEMICLFFSFITNAEEYEPMHKRVLAERLHAWKNTMIPRTRAG